MKAANRCLRIRVPQPGARESLDRLVAETWAAGAVGHEEIEIAGSASIELAVYFDAPAEVAVREAISALPGFAEAGPSQEVPDIDWVAEWRDSLAAVVVAERLVVRPESVEHPVAAQQIELVIDPGQAFGTGSHVSTRLALESVLAEAHGIGPATRVLDVGTGTGILALAALRLGAGGAIGFDVDPLAAPEALRAASRNGLAARFRAFTGGIESLGAGRFELVLANLLRSEVLPLAPALVSRLAASGRLLLSGLLDSDGPEVEAVFVRLGLRIRASRRETDEMGETWVSWVMARG